MIVELAVTRVSDDAVLPTRAHRLDAGLDLASSGHHVLAPGERCAVGTGLAVAVPEGMCGLVCPRSGLALKHGITLVNAPGVIDSGYRGELRVVLLNTDRDEAFTVEPGDRIAQLLLVPVHLAVVKETDDLSDAAGDGRAHGGFGSTGVAAAEAP